MLPDTESLSAEDIDLSQTSSNKLNLWSKHTLYIFNTLVSIQLWYRSQTLENCVPVDHTMTSCAMLACSRWTEGPSPGIIIHHRGTFVNLSCLRWKSAKLPGEKWGGCWQQSFPLRHRGSAQNQTSEQPLTTTSQVTLGCLRRDTHP